MPKYAEKYPAQSVVGAVNSIIYDLADGGRNDPWKTSYLGNIKISCMGKSPIL